MNKTLLVIVPGREVHEDSVFHILVAETGEHLASHLCSNSGFAYGDLYKHRPERIAKWTARFGELDVKYIDETDIPESELLRRNHEWGEKQNQPIESATGQSKEVRG
jgi:hypothetical protein